MAQLFCNLRVHTAFLFGPRRGFKQCRRINVMPKVKIGLNTDQRGELFAENANVFRPGLPSPWPPLRKMTWQEKRMCSSFGHTRTHRLLVPCVSWLLTRRVPDDPTPALTRIASTRLRIASSRMLRPTEPQTPLAGSTLMARSPVGQRHKFDVTLMTRCYVVASQFEYQSRG